MKTSDRQDRELARRKQRSWATFTAIYCWMRKLDGVMLEKQHLLRFLGFKKSIIPSRVKWLEEDFKDFFPCQLHLNNVDESGSRKNFHSLWLCRHWVKPEAWGGKLNTQDRLAHLKNAGYRMEVFEMWPQAKAMEMMKCIDSDLPANPDELYMASSLSLLCQGQIPASLLPSAERLVHPDGSRGLLKQLLAANGGK